MQYQEKQYLFGMNNENVISKIPVDLIVPFPGHTFKINQIRIERLAEDMGAVGQLQPVILREITIDGETVEYQTLIGHHRVGAKILRGDPTFLL